MDQTPPPVTAVNTTPKTQKHHHGHLSTPNTPSSVVEPLNQLMHECEKAFHQKNQKNTTNDKHTTITTITTTTNKRTKKNGSDNNNPNNGDKIFHMGYYNLLVLSIGYMITLLSYNTAQNFMTTIFGHNGFIALSIVYITYAFSTTITATIVKSSASAAKWSAVFANLGYVVFIGCCALSCALDSRQHKNPNDRHESTRWLLFAGSGIVGFTGALAWTAQGSILSSAAGGANEMGLFSGIFLCIFQLNAIFGSVISGIMQAHGAKDWVFFVVLLGVCLVGNVVLFLLRSNLRTSDYKSSTSNKNHNSGGYGVDVTATVDSDEDETDDSVSVNQSTEDLIETTDDKREGESLIRNHNEVKPKNRNSRANKAQRESGWILKNLKYFGRSVISSLAVTGKTIIRKEMLLLIPVFLQNGFSQSFFWGELPPLVGQELLGWVMTFFGAAECVGSLLFGLLSDKIGRRPIIFCAFMLHASAICFTFIMNKWEPYSFYFVLGMCGLADSALNAVTYNLIMFYFSRNPSDAFAVYNMFLSIALAAGFFTGAYASFNVVRITLSCILLVAVLSFSILDFAVSPADKSLEEEEEIEDVE